MNNMYDLFHQNRDYTRNGLPYDGTVNYFGKLFTVSEAANYLQLLRQRIHWKPDEVVMYGKTMTTKRKVAWYGDRPFPYTYSQVTKQALPWTEELLSLKYRVEQATGEAFNSCLLNLYHSGEEGMTWHSDAEKDLKKNGVIASLSFGAERKFVFKHKRTKAQVTVWLEHGSLLVMKGETQTHWLHRLPPTKKITRPRINLTFRQMEIR